MPSLKSQLETLLFISPKPFTVKKLIELTSATKSDILAAMDELTSEINQGGRGVSIVRQENTFQMTTAGENATLAENFVKEELTGELTKPSLETLTIIAYRGPITKIELELIRGVNCSLILRNLLMRGLIEAKEDRKTMRTIYEVTLNFVKYLGLNNVQELPDYAAFHNNENIDKLLHTGEKETFASE